MSSASIAETTRRCFLRGTFQHRNSPEKDFYYRHEAEEWATPAKELSLDSLARPRLLWLKPKQQGEKCSNLFNPYLPIFINYIYISVSSHCKFLHWEIPAAFLPVALLLKDPHKYPSGYLFVSFRLPLAVRLPISPLSTLLLHQLSCIRLTFVHCCAFGPMTGSVCVSTSLSPSQPQKIAGPF